MKPITVIALMTSDLTCTDTRAPSSQEEWEHITQTTQHSTHAGMLTICVVCPGSDFSPATLPATCQVLTTPGTSSWIERGIARAVATTPQSSAWLILAAQAPPPSDALLQMMADTVQTEQAVSLPTSGAHDTAIGLGSEFYSELIKLNQAGDLKKLIARYPMHQI
jgi:hypothetical protein